MLMSVSSAAIEGQMDGICPCSQLMWPYGFNNALVLLSPISLCPHQDYKQKKNPLKIKSRSLVEIVSKEQVKATHSISEYLTQVFSSSHIQNCSTILSEVL